LRVERAEDAQHEGLRKSGGLQGKITLLGENQGGNELPSKGVNKGRSTAERREGRYKKEGMVSTGGRRMQTSAIKISRATR